jgi:hypothetical protein
MSDKVGLGQYFTVKNIWLKKHILDFILSLKINTIVDPFAGAGDLLSIFDKLNYKIIGFDIDDKLSWTINDSLNGIPMVNSAMIVTNPPYLTNYSARRKNIYDKVGKYLDGTTHDDLYQVAIEKCFDYDYGVMIVPETFINSNFPKNRLHSITILEENPFGDTENPVCIICFDNRSKDISEVKVYKNDEEIGDLMFFNNLRKKSTGSIKIKFNSKNGNIALRAVDTTNPLKGISFMKKEELDYDLKGIKHSSRLITLVEINNVDDNLEKFLQKSNEILNSFRFNTKDVLLSPFKGNMKNGQRRRRLDYGTARSILEEAYLELDNNKLF